MSEIPGATIGRYKLLEPIGEGGMGTIWLAEQREPVKRRVALKIIKLGMDTKQVIARFEAERQALALMDHPHIAKVFDAGATDLGRPYFVMEYIKGIPIVEYCDSERLDMNARLELFTKVCHAIQHAHQKGIIHRDIKSSNVLVTMMDGAPIPKVIDFGIAKATAGDLTPKTLFTEHRQMIGTPTYMSPEQAEMSGLDIDTRSDVYSLGVLLYELLTGTTPFDSKSLLAAGHAEMMRVIREDEPHTPSRRISSLGDTGSRTAHKHHVDLKRLCTQLRGDLDWIVMKCLEKDRTRRYETATGLAADIKRHLGNEPVLAGPPGTGYKLKKFIRRNRGTVAATGVLAAALVLGAAGTTTGFIRMLDEKARADVLADKATQAADAEAKAKDEAQRNEREALAAASSAEAAQKLEESARKRAEAINEFVIATLRAGDAINANGGQNVTILSAMDRGIKDLDAGRFKDDPAIEAELKGTIGYILYNNGRWQEAESLLRKAVESERALPQGDTSFLPRDINNLALALHELGRKDEAKLLFAEALELNQRRFPGDHEAVAKSLQNLGGVVSPEESLALRRQSLEMRRRLVKGDSDPVAHALMSLGSGLLELGRTAEAEPLFAEAVEMGRRVFKRDHPFMAIALSNLGRARFDLGRRAEGVTMLTEALAIHRRIYNPPHPHLARSIHNLAWLLKEDGRSSEAEPLFVEALEMRDRCFKGDNVDTSYTLSCLGGVLLAQRRFAEAEPLYARALAMQRRLHPGDNADVALTLQDTAVMRRDAGRLAEAEPLQMQAVEMYQRLFPNGSRQLSLSLYTLADIRDLSGRFAEAVAPMEAAVAMDRKLLPPNHKDLLADLEKLARIYNLNRTFAKATPLYEEALKGYEATRGRQDPLTLLMIGNLGANYVSVGRASEGVPLLEEAWSHAKKHPKPSQVGAQLLDAYIAVADPAKPGSTDKAMLLFDEVLAFSRATFAKESPELAQELNLKSIRLLTLKAYARAEPLLREALAIREKHQPSIWTTFNTMSMLGEALLGQQKFTEAEPLLIAGYRGMTERESAVIKDRGAIRIVQALERLVKYYDLQGNTSEAASFRTKLSDAQSADSRPAPR